MTDLAEATLPDLVRLLMADGDLSEDDLLRIRDATMRERALIGQEQAWRETAHAHDEPHRSVVTAIPTEGLPEDQWPEEVDASGLVCHDCGRDLVSDRGSIRILVCPSLHGRRPAELAPADPDGAVECGRVRARE